MPLINYKVELKLKLKHYVSAAYYLILLFDIAIFPIKDTKLCVPVVTLSAKGKQKLSKVLGKGLERSVYWNVKTKMKEMRKDIFSN